MSALPIKSPVGSFEHFPPELVVRALDAARKLDTQHRGSLMTKMQAIHEKLTPKSEQLCTLLKKSADDIQVFQKEHLPTLRKGFEKKEREHRLSFLERFFK